MENTKTLPVHLQMVITEIENLEIKTEEELCYMNVLKEALSVFLSKSEKIQKNLDKKYVIELKNSMKDL